MNVKNIVTHHRPHLDEMYAIWLLRMFGKSLFPNVENAILVFLKKELEHTYGDDLYVGIGFGQFDEHRPNGRLENTCAAILVAEHLQIPSSPAMTNLLSDVLYCDTSNVNIGEVRLANLIKTMHRVKGGKDEFGTYKYAGVAFHGIVFGQRKLWFDIRVTWKEFVKERNIPTDTKAWSNVNRFINESYGRQNSHITELACIAGCLDDDVRIPWLTETFEMLMEDALEYCRVVEYLKKHNYSIDIDMPWGLEPACLNVCDSELISKALNCESAGKPAIAVIQRSSGHIQIFSDSKRKIDLTDFAAMVRMAEYTKRSGSVFSFESARGEGTKELCEVWHQPNKNTLLNGSLSHPGVEPSILSLGDIEDILIHAFTESRRQLWIAEYEKKGRGDCDTSTEAESLEGLLATIAKTS